MLGSSRSGSEKAAPLANLLARLEERYGIPDPPVTMDPMELLIWENIAYLANDERRARAFNTLKRTIGTRPDQILASPRAILTEI